MTTKRNQFHATYSLLRCPYCKHRLLPIRSYALRCACDTYPVIHNIVFLKKLDGLRHNRAVELLARNKVREAVLLLMDSRRLANFIATFMPYISYRLFFTILKICYPSGVPWWKYLANRSRRATHILTMASIDAVDRTDRIVDIGCGVGNFLSLVNKWSKPTISIGMDKSFFLLYIARSYMNIHKTLLVCTDVNNSLPIATSSMDKSFCNDSFMYFPHPQSVLRELRRILKPSGEAYLTHVHAKGFVNLGQGNGLNPQDIHRIAASMFRVGVASDKDLLSSILMRAPIRYVDKSSLAEQFKSYSYRLSATSSEQKPIRLSHILSQHVSSLTIDYSEDEELREGTIRT